MLSDEDKYQIELMYSSRATKVVVCSCLANLYIARRALNEKQRKTEWELQATGVPVLLLDTGEARSRQAKKLQVSFCTKYNVMKTKMTFWF